MSEFVSGEEEEEINFKKFPEKLSRPSLLQEKDDLHLLVSVGFAFKLSNHSTHKLKVFCYLKTIFFQSRLLLLLV